KGIISWICQSRITGTVATTSPQKIAFQNLHRKNPHPKSPKVQTVLKRKSLRAVKIVLAGIVSKNPTAVIVKIREQKDGKNSSRKKKLEKALGLEKGPEMQTGELNEILIPDTKPSVQKGENRHLLRKENGLLKSGCQIKNFAPRNQQRLKQMMNLSA